MMKRFSEPFPSVSTNFFGFLYCLQDGVSIFWDSDRYLA